MKPATKPLELPRGKRRGFLSTCFSSSHSVKFIYGLTQEEIKVVEGMGKQ